MTIQFNMKEARKYMSALIMLVALCGLAVAGRATISAPEDLPGVIAVPPQGMELMRASVVKKTPGNFILDTRKFANIGLNETAPDFAIYTSSSIPSKCGDFRDVSLSTWKVSKYRRAYNFEGKPEAIKALKHYGCIAVKNPNGIEQPEETEEPSDETDEDAL